MLNRKNLSEELSNNFVKNVVRIQDQNILSVDRGRMMHAPVICFYTKLIKQKYKYNSIVLSDSINGSQNVKSKNLFKKFGFNRFIKGFSYYLFFVNPLMFIKALILTIKIIFLIKKNGQDWFVNRYKFNNIRIGDLIHDYYIRFGNGYLKTKVDIKFTNILFKAIVRVLNISNIIESEKIKYIIVGTETYAHNDAIALRLGLDKKIPVIEPDDLSLGFYKYSKRSISHGKFRVSDSINIKFEKNISKINKFLKNRFLGKTKAIHSGTHILKKTNKKSKYITRSNFLKKFSMNNSEIKKIVLFSCHALTDANHAWGNNFLFLNYYTHLKETLKFVNKINNPNVLWLIKPHPTTLNPEEFGQIQYLVKKFNNKKIIVPPKNMMSYNLTNICDNVITGRGTVGMEFACLGKYPITVGSSIYSNLGFSLEFKNKKKYFKQLENIEMIRKLPKEKTLLAKQTLYYLDNGFDPFSDQNSITSEEKILLKSQKFIADRNFLLKNLKNNSDTMDFKNNKFTDFLLTKI